MLKLHPNSARLGALTEYSQLNDERAERDWTQHLRQTVAGREYSTKLGLLQGLVPANQRPTRQVLVAHDMMLCADFGHFRLHLFLDQV